MHLALDPLPILYLLVLDPLAQSPVRPTKATLHLRANGLAQPNPILPHFPRPYHHCKISHAELEVVPGWACRPPSWRPSIGTVIRTIRGIANTHFIQGTDGDYNTWRDPYSSSNSNTITPDGNFFGYRIVSIVICVSQLTNI